MLRKRARLSSQGNRPYSDLFLWSKLRRLRTIIHRTGCESPRHPCAWLPGHKPLHSFRVSLDWTLQETRFRLAIWSAKVSFLWHNYFEFVEKRDRASETTPPFETWSQKDTSKQGTFCDPRMLFNGWNLICSCYLTSSCDVSALSQRGWRVDITLQLRNEND